MVGEGGVSSGGSSCLGTTRGSDLWNDGDDAWKGGNEFFMTRGHQHQKAECAETYFRFIRRGDSPCWKVLMETWKSGRFGRNHGLRSALLDS